MDLGAEEKKHKATRRRRRPPAPPDDMLSPRRTGVAATLYGPDDLSEEAAWRFWHQPDPAWPDSAGIDPAAWVVVKTVSLPESFADYFVSRSCMDACTTTEVVEVCDKYEDALARARLSRDLDGSFQDDGPDEPPYRNVQSDTFDDLLDEVIVITVERFADLKARTEPKPVPDFPRLDTPRDSDEPPSLSVVVSPPAVTNPAEPAPVSSPIPTEPGLVFAPRPSPVSPSARAARGPAPLSHMPNAPVPDLPPCDTPRDALGDEPPSLSLLVSPPTVAGLNPGEIPPGEPAPVSPPTRTQAGPVFTSRPAPVSPRAAPGPVHSPSHMQLAPVPELPRFGTRRETRVDEPPSLNLLLSPPIFGPPYSTEPAPVSPPTPDQPGPVFTSRPAPASPSTRARPGPVVSLNHMPHAPVSPATSSAPASPLDEPRLPAVPELVPMPQPTAVPQLRSVPQVPPFVTTAQLAAMPHVGAKEGSSLRPPARTLPEPDLFSMPPPLATEWQAPQLSVANHLRFVPSPALQTGAPAVLSPRAKIGEAQRFQDSYSSMMHNWGLYLLHEAQQGLRQPNPSTFSPHVVDNERLARVMQSSASYVPTPAVASAHSVVYSAAVPPASASTIPRGPASRYARPHAGRNLWYSFLPTQL